MKEDEEIEMLLEEIPHATSHNICNPHNSGHNLAAEGGNVNGSFVSINGMLSGVYDDDPSSHYKYTSPSSVSGFSLRSDGSSSRLISSGYSLSDYGSPTPPNLEEIKSQMFCKNSQHPNGSMFDFKVLNCLVGKKANGGPIDELGLYTDLKRMYISEEPEDVPVDSNRFLLCDHYCNGANRVNDERNRAYDNYSKVYSDYGVIHSSVARSPKSLPCEMSSTLFGLQQGYELGSPLGSQYIPGQANDMSFQTNCGNTLGGSSHYRNKEPTEYYWQRGIPALNLASPVSSPGALLSARHGINLIEESGTSNLPRIPHLTYTKPHLSVENVPVRYPPMLDGRMRASNNRIPHVGFEGYTEDGLIITGEGVNYAMKKGFGHSKGHSYKGSLQDIGVCKSQERGLQLDGRPQFAGTNENGRSARVRPPISLPFKFDTLEEAQGYIYLMAKDQHGCRFLQRIFDEGTPVDVKIIFNEIIDHVVELMMNPFGNYLMQKLLEVCNEEQRMQILLMVTEQPSELVRISLNTHGTRVVQKLIETLKTRQQILLVISAVEPGFLVLIKDLNGNHVVQRCLQCLSNEDNKFIFIAAAKYCVDIATHQHGCCVLQRCISHSTGENRENLVAEISSNGLLLAQDAFGNYVVQYIVEQKIPYATSKLVSQFEGNYVHLSTQKFSSHVVEKCLLVLSDEVRSKIIHELLSASHFEQLLQDPHANYVIQTALRISEGPLHNSLVEAIESHKATSRNSPYSKRIFSHKLLKK